jgi:hypothetical protein
MANGKSAIDLTSSDEVELSERFFTPETYTSRSNSTAPTRKALQHEIIELADDDDEFQAVIEVSDKRARVEDDDDDEDEEPVRPPVSKRYRRITRERSKSKRRESRDLRATVEGADDSE